MAAAVLLPTPQVAQTVEEAQPVSRVPLMVIDGTPRPELNTMAAVRADFDARIGTAKFGTIQMVDSVRAMRLYGRAALRGATVVWTKAYLGKGGAVLPESLVTNRAAEEEMKSKAALNAAAAVNARLLQGLSLSKEQADLVYARVVLAESVRERLRGPATVRSARLIEVYNRRDSLVRAVITDPEQRAVYDRNAREQMKIKAVPSVAELSENDVVYNFFGDIPVSPRDIEAAIRVVEASYNEELALWARTPADTAALAQLHTRRIAGVRAVLDTDAKRVAFDKRLPLIRSSLQSW